MMSSQTFDMRFFVLGLGIIIGTFVDPVQAGSSTGTWMNSTSTSLWVSSSRLSEAPTTSSDFCANSPCYNGGTCLQRNGTIYCLCQEGFSSAKNCSECLDGFQITDSQCKDVNECETLLPTQSLSKCPKTGSFRCQNTIGNYICDCTTGSYKNATSETCTFGQGFISFSLQYRMNMTGKLTVETNVTNAINALLLSSSRFVQSQVLSEVKSTSILELEIVLVFSSAQPDSVYISNVIDNEAITCRASCFGLPYLAQIIAPVTELSPCNLFLCPVGTECSHNSTWRTRFQCTCASGFTYVSSEYTDGGYMETCQDVDECAATVDLCGSRGTCINNVGSYTCSCDSGSHLDNFTCMVYTTCDSLPCQNGGTCLPKGSSYSCQCNWLHSGDNCESSIPLYLLMAFAVVTGLLLLLITVILIWLCIMRFNRTKRGNQSVFCSRGNTVTRSWLVDNMGAQMPSFNTQDTVRVPTSQTNGQTNLDRRPESGQFGSNAEDETNGNIRKAEFSTFHANDNQAFQPEENVDSENEFAF